MSQPQNRHARRVTSSIQRKMKRQAEQAQAAHFETLKRAIVGLICPRHNRPCSTWWQVTGKGLIAICDTCAEGKPPESRLLRVLPKAS